MAEDKAKRKWRLENTVFIGIKLQKSTDKDILEFLEKTVDREHGIGTQTVIKTALRYYMEHKEE